MKKVLSNGSHRIGISQHLSDNHLSFLYILCLLFLFLYPVVKISVTCFYLKMETAILQNVISRSLKFQTQAMDNIHIKRFDIDMNFSREVVVKEVLILLACAS